MDLPDRAGVMILGGAILFPQAVLPLYIFEPRYRQMLAHALETHRMFCVAMQRPGTERETPLPVAGVGLIRASMKNPDGTSSLFLQGLTRVRLGKALRYKPYRVHAIEPLGTGAAAGPGVQELRARVLDLVDLRLRQPGVLRRELLQQLAGAVSGPGQPSVEKCLETLRQVENAGRFADLIALLLLSEPLAQQVILQTLDAEERLRHLAHFLLADATRARREASDEAPE
ncbi:MAG: LON peptidase substrate-binding domain-containing protein [Verrucomicrobiota bacterium]